MTREQLVRIAGGYERIAGGGRACDGGGSQRWCRGDDVVLGVQQLKSRDGSTIVGTLAVRSGRDFKSHGVAVCTRR